MKKMLLSLTLATFVISGCSKTWDGMKQDTYDLFDNTKEAIHEATAPDNTLSIEQDATYNSALPKVGDTVKVDPSKTQSNVEMVQSQTTITATE